MKEKIERKLDVLYDLLYTARYYGMTKRITSSNMVTPGTVFKTVKNMFTLPGLTREQFKEARDYYYPYKISTFMHRKITNYTGKFDPSYLPMEMYFAQIDPYFNDHKRAPGLENKALFARLFPGIKQPEAPLSCINGFWMNDKYEMLSKKQVLDVVMSYKDLFLKNANESFGGAGVRRIKSDSPSEMKHLFISAVKGLGTDIIVQLPIHQHRDLARFNPDSINTLRVISLLKKDEVKIYSVILRMGSGSTYVDNFSSGGLLCGVDTNGKLMKYGYDHQRKYEAHPYTNQVFENSAVPGYAKMIEAIKKAHPMLPCFRLISWDYCIDENGEPVMIEANLTNGGTAPSMITKGTLFGDDTLSIVKTALKNSDFPKRKICRKKCK